MISLLGLSQPFITASFFDDNDGKNEDNNEVKVSLSEVQVILLLLAIMYIIIGSTLEYVKNIEFKVIIPLLISFGILKVAVSILYF
jgi:hypothetical protein